MGLLSYARTGILEPDGLRLLPGSSTSFGTHLILLPMTATSSVNLEMDPPAFNGLIQQAAF